MTDIDLSQRLGDRLCTWLNRSYWHTYVPQFIQGLSEHLQIYVEADPVQWMEQPEDFSLKIQELLTFHEERTQLLRNVFSCPE